MSQPDGGVKFRRPSGRRRALLRASAPPMAVLALVLAGTAWLVAVYVPRERDRALAVWSERVGDAARDRAALAAEWAGTRLADAARVARFPATSDALAGDRRKRDHLASVLEIVRRSRGLLAVEVRGSGGSLVAHAGDSERAARAPGTAAAELVSGPDGAPRVRFVAPVEGAGGLAIGSVALIEDPSTRLAALLLPDDGIGLGARVRLLAPAGRKGLEVVRGTDGAARVAAAGPAPGGAAVDVAAPVSGTPWKVEIAADEPEILATIRSRVRSDALLGAGWLVALAAAAWALWRGERARYVREAADARARLVGTLDHANDGILFIRASDGRILDANACAEEMLGRKRRTLTALTIGQLRPEGRPDDIADLMRRATERGGLVFETTYARADGTPFPVEISTRPIDVHGERIFVSIVRDLTAARRVERQLRESRELVDLALEASEAGAWTWDQVDKRFEWDDNVATMFGQTSSTRVGPFSELTGRMHPDDRERVREQIARDVATRKTVDSTYRVVLPNGETRHIEGKGRVYRDGGGRPVRVSGLAFDVTERERAAEALGRIAERFRAVVEASPLAIIGIERDGGVFLWNDAAERMFGWSDAEVIGRENPIVPHARAAEFADLRARVFRGEYVHDVELERVRKDGSPLTVRLYAAPLYESGREVVGLIGMLTDVTQEKQLEAQLRQAQKMEAVGQLAGGIAHDFNNLLTAISGYGELARMSVDHDHPIRHALDEVLAASGRAAALTRQLLAFSRRQILQPRVLDLGDLVRGMEGMIRRLIGEDVALDVRIAPGPTRVRADPGQLEQVVLNLVVNARDAMPSGGRIALEVDRSEWTEDAAARTPGTAPGPVARLAVRDSGPGIPIDVLPRVFEPFFTTKEQGKGTGLGLSTAYGIVKQSGGHIRAESEPGAGALFVVLLPRVDDPAAPVRKPAAEAATPAPSDRGNETVLVVEDEESVRSLVCDALRLQGYTVLEAADAERAREIARGHRPAIDLLVADVVLPGRNGLDLARDLEAERPALRVLMMSGHVQHSILDRGVLPADVAFLQKPFSTGELARKVREVLDAPGGTA